VRGSKGSERSELPNGVINYKLILPTRRFAPRPGKEGWSYTWTTTPSRYADDDVDGTNIPPAYLTNWGFCAVWVYFLVATICSFSNYKRKGTADSPNSER